MKLLANLFVLAGIALLAWGAWSIHPTFGKLALGVLLLVSGIAWAKANQPKG